MRLAFLVLIGLVLLPAERAVPQPVSTAKLVASDQGSGDRFGLSVSISANRTVVGAFLDDDYERDSGSAYVFHSDGGWVQESKLHASDGLLEDWFGFSVSISQDRVVVGAIGDDDKGSGSGSAYVFGYQGGSWVEEAKLLASDATGSEILGHSVSVSGDRIVVGAMGDDDKGSDSGSAYVFRYDGATWTEEAKLTASDGSANDLFGFSVCLSGEVVVVGARYDDDRGDNSGSAYVYRFDGTTWVEEAKLLASDGAAADSFGFSTSVSGDTIVIGANDNDNENGTNAGSAYVFRRNGPAWVQATKLLSSDGASEDFLGTSVSVAGDVMVIGAAGDDNQNGNGAGSGYVYAFDGSSWVEEAKLIAFDGLAGDLGSAVSVSDASVVLGAPRSDAAYVFGLALGDADGDGVDDAIDNCDDIENADQADADANGVGDACNSFEDLDGDEWADVLDNCPNAMNADQADTDGDGLGDACDPFPTQADHVLAQALGDLAAAQEALAETQAELLATQEALAECQTELAQCVDPATACSDGLDNDGDGLVDYRNDPHCWGPQDDSENRSRCGLGFELALILPLLVGARRLRRGSSLLCVFVVASVITTGFAARSSATAIVVYTNLGPDDAPFFRTDSIHDVLNLEAYLEHAGRFVVPVGTSFSLTGIDLALDDSIIGSLLSLTIWSDAGGQPGTALESVVVASPSERELRHVAMSGVTTLYQGATYWLSAAAINPGRIGWFVNSTGAGGYAATYDLNHSSPWIVIDDPVAAPQGAFRVWGEAAAVPEASPALLIVLGFICACPGRWRSLRAGKGQRVAARSAR